MPSPQHLCAQKTAMTRFASWFLTAWPYVWGVAYVIYQQTTPTANIPLIQPPSRIQHVQRITPNPGPAFTAQTPIQRTLFTETRRPYHTEAPRPESTLIWQLLYYPDNPLWAERMVALGAGVDTLIERLEGVEYLPEELKVLQGRSLLQFVLSLGYYNVAHYLLSLPSAGTSIEAMFPHFPSRQFALTGLVYTLNPVPPNDPWHSGRWANVFPITLALNPHIVPELNAEGQRTGRFIRPQNLDPDQRNDLLAQRNAFLLDWINDERFNEQIALRPDTYGNTILHYLLTAYMPPVTIANQLIQRFPALRSIRNDNGLMPWMWAATRGVQFQLEEPSQRVLPHVIEEESEWTRKEK